MERVGFPFSKVNGNTKEECCIPIIPAPAPPPPPPAISCRNFTSCPTGMFKNPSKNGNTKEECCEASCDDVICPADMFTNRRSNIDAGQECCRKTDPNDFAFDR